MTNQEVEVLTGQKLFLHLKEIIWLVLRKIGTLSDATRWLVNLEQSSVVIQPSLIATSGQWDNQSFGPSTRNENETSVLFFTKNFISRKIWQLSSKIGRSQSKQILLSTSPFSIRVVFQTHWTLIKIFWHFFFLSEPSMKRFWCPPSCNSLILSILLCT